MLNATVAADAIAKKIYVLLGSSFLTGSHLSIILCMYVTYRAIAKH